MPHEVKLGQLIEDAGQQRDALHFACAPVVAAEGEKLFPGQDIGFVEGSSIEVGSSSPNPLGIVDPFLKKPVYQGERFWMLLYPNTITSLRHDWEHPAFGVVEVKADGSPTKLESETWLRAYASRWNPYIVEDDGTEAAFQHLLRGLRSGEIYHKGCDLHALYELEDADDLKLHAENYLGIAIEWGRFEFTCLC